MAIDTSGNVEHSNYKWNKFEEVDGKCIDLDGFHDGSIIENKCTNRGTPASYPFGHFGIVMNNTDPNMRSQNIEIRGNVIDGTKFGGLFLMGSGHQVTGNSFLHLNLAGCNEVRSSSAAFIKRMNRDAGSRVYLSKGVVRMEPVRDTRSQQQNFGPQNEDALLRRGRA